MQRRNFLKAAGCTVFLPALESFGQTPADVASTKPKRFFNFHVGVGLFVDVLPQSFGKAYELGDAMQSLDAHRNQFTLYSNMVHGRSHANQHTVFMDRGTGTTMDQEIADTIGHHTPKKNIAILVGAHNNVAVSSWKNGLPVTPIESAQLVFNELFAQVDKKQEVALLARKRSVLDACLENTKVLKSQVSGHDKAKLEEYFNSLRESELELAKSHKWLNTPRAEVEFPSVPKYSSPYFPDDAQQERFLNNGSAVQRGLVFSMIHTAFKYDVTRVVNVHMPALDAKHHYFTHDAVTYKGGDGAKILTKYDASLYLQMAEFFRMMSDTKTDSGATLMDESIIVATCGNSIGAKGGSHNGKALPVFVAGGKYSNHGQNIDRTGLSTFDIYNTIMRDFGVDIGTRKTAEL